MLTRPLTRKLTRPLFGGVEEWVDPLADIPFVLRLQTHRGDGVPLGLYQDTACTIPATEDGHPVAAWRDELSGSGITAAQNVSANRPTLRFYGGVPVVSFGGTDDYLEYTSSNLAVNRRTAVVGSRVIGPTGGTLMSFRRSAKGYLLRQLISAGIVSIGGDIDTTNQDISLIDLNSWHTSTWSQDASRNTSYRHNGVPVAVTGNPPLPESGADGFVIGAIRTAFDGYIQYFSGDMSSILVVSGESLDSEKIRMEDYATSLMPQI